MHNTTKYINISPEIIKGYNNSYHSGIKKIPIEVKANDENIDEILFKKYMKAKKDEPVFEIGQRVRCIINRKTFEKNRCQNGVKQYMTLHQKQVIVIN